MAAKQLGTFLSTFSLFETKMKHMQKQTIRKEGKEQKQEIKAKQYS